MALVKETLVTEIRKITDKDYSLFEGFPETDTEVGERWAYVINEYAKSVIPTSISSEAAKLAFQSSMVGTSAPGAGLVVFPAAFTAYAAALGVGMSPAFIATPPPTPIVLAPVFSLGFGGASAEVCANAMADVIDIWFKTGTATPSTGGSPVTWS